MINKINKLSKSEFIKVFANIFENARWIAEELYNQKSFTNFEELSSKILDIFETTTRDKQLKILNAHPDLAIGKRLTEDSKNEQQNAGLNQCTNEEFLEFKKLNEEYKKKFGFPFITAVKGKNKEEILNSFRQRIANNINLEFEEAKKQVKKIANFRLSEIIK